MFRIYFFLLVGTLFSFSCNHERNDRPDNPTARIDHIRWGSKNNPLEGVVISWRDKSLNDKIQWGYTKLYEKGEFEAQRDSDFIGEAGKFSYIFNELIPSSIIYYRLYDSESNLWTEEKTFKTAPDPRNNHFKFTAGGDSRTNIDDWHLVSEAIEVCDFSLYLGDLAISGVLDPAWEDWYSRGEKFISRNLVFYTRGGHDFGDNYGNNLTNPGNGLFYSFTFGNSVFISLDSQGSASWEEQTVFLEKTLKKNQDKKWKFLFFHSPFFTSQVHVGEMDTLRSTWWKLFDDYGVDFVFNGHEHTYMRTVPLNLNISDTSRVAEYGSGPGQGRCQIISGQYGAPHYGLHEGWFVEKTFIRLHYTRVEVNGNTLQFKAIDAATGEIFDQLNLVK